MTVTRNAPSDVLRVADLTAGQLHALLDLADAMRDEPASWTRRHPRTAVACLFDQPSARTRVSFEVAAHRLGMLPIVLQPGELGLGPGAPLRDTALVLSSYSEAIVVGTPAQATLAELADAATVPVINGLTDEHHPCQALADLLTLRRHFGHLHGLRLAYIGNGDNVAHSLMEAGALAGMHVVVAGPAGHEPDRDVTARAATLADLHGGSVHVGRDPQAAAAGADAVYGGAWGSRSCRVDAAVMGGAAPGALFMHCPPARCGEETTAEVVDGPGSVLWEQAANRLPTAQALLHAIVTHGWER